MPQPSLNLLKFLPAVPLLSVNVTAAGLEEIATSAKVIDTPIYCRHESFKDETHVYLAFEYVQGGEIFRLLRKENLFPNDVALFYITEIVLALEYLHKQKIAYRDLKPENLLVAGDGHMKITDFGFAKQINDRTFTLCGTPEYLAPEIIMSIGHNGGVDWWALGILIFEMLAGYPPFYDQNPYEVYRRITVGYFEFPA